MYIYSEMHIKTSLATKLMIFRSDGFKVSGMYRMKEGNTNEGIN